MQPPLEIVYRDHARIPVLEEKIREQAGCLARDCHDLCSCRLTLETARGRCAAGCRVRLEMLTAPGEELTAAGAAVEDGALEQALDRLFEDARQQLTQASQRHHQEATELRMAVLTAL